MSNPDEPTFEQLGQRVGALVDTKNKAYGSSFDDAGNFLKLLYPNGIQPSQYGDALALVRIFDKMKRIATDRDALGESPYQDITGYGLLGLRRVERERSALRPTDPAPPEATEVPEPPCAPCEVPQTMGDRLALKGFNGVLDLGSRVAGVESFQKAASSLAGISPMIQVSRTIKKKAQPRKGKKR